MASFTTAILVALVLGLLNTLVKPLLLILTLPITILTLGLFTVVIDIFVVLLASSIVPGFEVDGFINALLFSFVSAILSSILDVAIH